MSFNKNWEKARIAAKIYYIGSDGTTYLYHTCSLVNRVTFRQVNNFKAYHGLNQWNQGVIELPPEFTFTIAVAGVSASARLLRALHAAGTPFNIELFDEQDSDEFALKNEVLIECRLTSKEVTIEVGNMPMIVYNGMALRYSFSDGEDMDVNGSGIPIETKMFGSGKAISDTIDLFKEWS